MLLTDDLYFQYTNGGVTFGGGEPLLNYKLIIEFMDLVKEHNKTVKFYPWNINFESCFNVPYLNIYSVLNRHSDIIGKMYIDLKCVDNEFYKKYTRVNLGNQRVINNLKNVIKFMGDDWVKEHICIRLPNIPNFYSVSESDIEYVKSLGISESNIMVFDYEIVSPIFKLKK